MYLYDLRLFYNGKMVPKIIQIEIPNCYSIWYKHENGENVSCTLSAKRNRLLILKNIVAEIFVFHQAVQLLVYVRFVHRNLTTSDIVGDCKQEFLEQGRENRV